MKARYNKLLLLGCSGILLAALAMYSCKAEKLEEPNPELPELDVNFPEFITSTADYFDTRIASVPHIEKESYQLKISGAVENPGSFTLDELSKLEMLEKTLTIECIGNSANGTLIGTAAWTGFRVYDLLNTLGIKEGASTVKYISADGYYTYNTLEELQSGGVLGALYMNNESLDPLYGFPLRILFPGYYGVRQPGWITEMEVLETGPEDFWSKSGWKSETPMTLDSKIFFPANSSSFASGDSIKVGGAAFGSEGIASVHLTLDDGESWIPAKIVRQHKEDHVWVFWEAIAVPPGTGKFSLRSRATALDGSLQQKSDSTPLDGTNSWPSVSISVD